MRNKKKKNRFDDSYESSCSPSISYPPLFQLCIPVACLVFLTLLAISLPPTGKAYMSAHVRVAFIGNSITFVNDIPRLVETMAQGRLKQDSCLHGSLNLMTILTKGNGMYSKWQTQNAFVKHITTSQEDQEEEEGENNNNTIIYDFGACSVPQLLLGHDANLYSDTFFYDDGKNPCLANAHYLDYRESMYPIYATATKKTNYWVGSVVSDSNTDEPPIVIQERPEWDFVVMNDQTQYPATFQRRRRSILVLKQVYAPLFLETGAVPIFLMTHGYTISSNRKASQLRLLGDIPAFTSHLYYGYRQYVNALGQKLPTNQHPRMANAGLAFLTIYEENVDLWKKLFFVDGFHPSPHGSYLIGCVLYATIFQRMPPSPLINSSSSTSTSNSNSSFSTTPEASALFARARRMQLESGPEMSLPTAMELRTLNNVCRRVALQDYKPPSLLSLEETEQLELENQDTGYWYHTDTVNVDDDVFSEEEEDYDYDDDDNLDDDGGYNDAVGGAEDGANGDENDYHA